MAADQDRTAIRSWPSATSGTTTSSTTTRWSMIRQGLLGDLHYIRAQWHRGNLPGNDSWQPPLPGERRSWPSELTAAGRPSSRRQAQGDSRSRTSQPTIARVGKQDRAEGGPDRRHRPKIVAPEVRLRGPDDQGSPADVYDRPAIEELIRWRLWDRTGGGLMAELGSHQLDAASIFIAAHARRTASSITAERRGRRQPAALPARPRRARTTSTASSSSPRPGYDAEATRSPTPTRRSACSTPRSTATASAATARSSSAPRAR